MYTDKQIQDLIDAMDQLLDDMGVDGQSVCLAAKAQARIAFDPFLDQDCTAYIMPLAEAQAVLAEAQRS
jgi:hypothetical protein